MGTHRLATGLLPSRPLSVRPFLRQAASARMAGGRCKPAAAVRGRTPPQMWEGARDPPALVTIRRPPPPGAGWCNQALLRRRLPHGRGRACVGRRPAVAAALGSAASAATARLAAPGYWATHEERTAGTRQPAAVCPCTQPQLKTHTHPPHASRRPAPCVRVLRLACCAPARQRPREGGGRLTSRVTRAHRQASIDDDGGPYF